MLRATFVGGAWISIASPAPSGRIGFVFLGRYTLEMRLPRHDSIRLGPEALQRPRKHRSRYCHLLNEAVTRGDERVFPWSVGRLIAALGQLKDLKIIGAVVLFVSRRKRNLRLSGEGGVSTLLEGTVKKQKPKTREHVRIVAYLIPADVTSCGANCES